MKVLDLYCCQGGAARGYADAGAEVTGIDILDQPRYPYRFIQANALHYLAEHAGEYDLIHASPPCQAYSETKTLSTKVHPRLLALTRAMLKAGPTPWVIENVPGARLYGYIELCGSMFGLSTLTEDGVTRQLVRHRWFESSFPLTSPAHQSHGPLIASVYGSGGGGKHAHGYKATKQDAERLMRIDWMTKRGLAQAIPPAYTEHIARQFLAWKDAA